LEVTELALGEKVPERGNP